MKHLFAVEQMGAGLAQITKVYLKRQMETETLNYQKAEQQLELCSPH